MLLLLSLLACNKDTDGDGVLDEVDCDLDNPALAVEVLAWIDEDGDGFGGGDPVSVCDYSGMVLAGGDCDDANADVNPDAAELCDGVDNDCSGGVDEQAIDQEFFYLDYDGDGFGNADWQTSACEAPQGYVADASDCDDQDGAVNPDAEEVCNGVDDDCDGAADDETATGALTWYADADGDGWGDAGDSVLHCEWQEGYVDNADDCDDGDGAISPSAEELCDGVDNDCDGAVDHDGWLPGDYADLDDVMANAPDGAHVCLGEGTFTGTGYERIGSLTLQGSGRDLTLLDADHDNFVSFEEDDALGLADLQVVNAWATDTYGRGALASFGGDSDLVLRRVTLRDSGCDSYRSCQGGLVYFEEGGSADIDDVEVDGFGYDGDTGYTYSWFPGLFYFYRTDVDIDGLEIHGLQVENVRTTYGGCLYQEYGQLQVNDLWYHDNSVSGRYAYGAPVYVEEAFTSITMANVTIADNSTAGTYYYSGSLGLFLDDAHGGSVVTNLEVTDNTVDAGNYGYTYGLGFYTYLGSHDVQNVLVAGNSYSSEGAGYVYGGLAYFDYGLFRLANATFADNSFEGADGVYGSVVYAYTGRLDLWNVDASGNDYELESGVYGGVYVEDVDYTGGFDNAYDTTQGDAWVWDGGAWEPLIDAAATSLDPGYSDAANGDYTLAGGSPLIDAGNPDILDADGSVSDVGAYGGPLGESW